MPTVTPFLMFQGGAEEAIERYVAVIPDSRVVQVQHHENGGVARGDALLAGQAVRFYDSPVQHAFTFTPALSLFVTVGSAEELDRIVDALSVGGEFLMPTGDYGFSPRFAWFNDAFGVSWQINLEPQHT